MPTLHQRLKPDLMPDMIIVFQIDSNYETFHRNFYGA